MIINRLEGKEERAEKIRKIRASKSQEYSSMITSCLNLALPPVRPLQARQPTFQNNRKPIIPAKPLTNHIGPGALPPPPPMRQVRRVVMENRNIKTSDEREFYGEQLYCKIDRIARPYIYICLIHE